MVKVTAIFHQSGYCRAKKVLNITGLYKEWDQSKQTFKTRNAENQVKNNLLSETKLKYLKVAEEWELEGRSWTPAQWSNCFDTPEVKTKKVKVLSVIRMIDELIEEFGKKERFKNGEIIGSSANVKEYKLLKNSLSNFTRDKYKKGFSSYYFTNLNETFLNDYTVYLQVRGAEKGNKGGVIQKLKKLKAVCNYASQRQIPGATTGIFKCVDQKMKTNKFIPKTIPYYVIQEIERMDKNGFTKKQLFHIDLFLFSFYAGGIGNTDVAHLKKGCIKDSFIEYERSKVAKDANVPLVNKAEAIIRKYISASYQDYVFPIFTYKHQTNLKKKNRVESISLRVNKTLEKVRKKLDYKDKITWYSARGSFITKMLDDGFHPVQVAGYAGNSPDVIYKHYYKATNQDEARTRMNKNLQ
ncbi:phage integrase SAM-like domain-containing protein [Dysgonomonas termitidis]